MLNTYVTEGKRFVRTWLCDSSGGYKRGVLLGSCRVLFATSSIFLIVSSAFQRKSMWEESMSDPWISHLWYEGMAHTMLIVCWLYYKENQKKTKGFVWILFLFLVGSGVTLAYITKELSFLTPEEEFVTILFRRTDVVRRHDSVLEFNDKHPMMTNNKKKKSGDEKNKGDVDEVEPSDLLDF